MTAHLPVLAVAAVLAGAGIGAGTHLLAAKPADAGGSRAGLEGDATWAAGAQPAPPITALRDQSGRVFSLSSLRGRTVAIVFFDSHYNQACPLEGRALAAAVRTLPAARRPVLVAVSVNPRDTRASVRRAARAWGLSHAAAGWHWLLGTRRALAPVWRAYRIYVGPEVDGDIAHTEALYLLDRRGFERSAYLYPFIPRSVSRDLGWLAASRSA